MKSPEQISSSNSPNASHDHFILSIRCAQENLATFINQEASHISPQLLKRLSSLIEALDADLDDDRVVRCLKNLFDRLLLELLQAQSNTKYREQEIIRKLDRLGCSIRDPELTDKIIELVVKLYRAAGQCGDTSFERNALIKYLLKELAAGDDTKKPVERIVQTLYRCSSFIVLRQDGSPSRLSLKPELYDRQHLRYHYNLAVIEIARESSIILTAESWAYILHGRASPEHIASIQSILDRNYRKLTVIELESYIRKSGDRLNIRHKLTDLYAIETALQQPKNKDSYHQILIETLRLLSNNKHLFVVRQCRTQALAKT